MSESVAPEPEWNGALEQVLRKEAERSEGLHVLHADAARWASRRNDSLAIPGIILASVTGFFSATSDMIPPVAIGAMSLSVAIVNTLNSYYKYSQRAEGHRITAQLYLKIYKHLEVELSLPREQRTAAEALLKDMRDKMARISETAPELPSSILEQFRAKYHDADVAKPLGANGLDRVEVFAATAPATPRSFERPRVFISVGDRAEV